jgi:hypothetical protein
MSVRSLVQSGDLPKVTSEFGEQKYNEFQRAICSGTQNKFKMVSQLFTREMDTEISLGAHLMCGFIGDAYSGARETVYAVAKNHEITILDLTAITEKALHSLPIRDLVRYILDTPPRCAVLLRVACANDRMYKVVKRLARTELKTNNRRVVFCITRDEGYLPTGMRIESFPGTEDDRIAMLLYRVPTRFVDPVRLCRIAKYLQDYAVFEPKIQRLLCMDGTIDQYFQSLYFQVAKIHAGNADYSLDDFPSFEVDWRRGLSRNLNKLLVPRPDVTSQSIHRVFPMGVCKMEAIQCFQSALPPDLTTPYVLTVDSNAIDDKCGRIALTQRTQHIVIDIKCKVDPGILTEVCRELRAGYRSVVQELSHTKSDMNAKLSTLHADMDHKISSLHDNMDKKLSTLHEEIGSLKDILKTGHREKKRSLDENGICNKKSCMNLVTERFSHGGRKRQCISCIRQANLWKVSSRLSNSSPKVNIP